MYSEYNISNNKDITEIGFFMIDKDTYGGVMNLEGELSTNSKAIFMLTKKELQQIYNFIEEIFKKEEENRNESIDSL